MNIKEALDAEILDEIEQLKEVEVTSDEYKAAIDGVTKLLDRSIELEKVKNDRIDKSESREIEMCLREQEMDNERKDRLVKNTLTGVSIVTGIGLTVWGTIKSLKFEETGTVTTIMGRGFINKLLPKK